MSGIKKVSTAGALLAAMAMAACTSNGQYGDGSVDGSSGGINGSSGSSGAGASSGPANDGTGPTNITSGGKPVSGNFICTSSARLYGSPTTVVGTGGLVGGPLTALLNLLGASTVTELLNSVSEPNNVIDGKLATYATFSATVGLISSLLDTVDLSVVLPTGAAVPAGKYAVYGLSFPKGTVDASILNQIEVATYLGSSTTAQDSNTISQNALTLLGAIGGSDPTTVWLGVKTTAPYDRATIRYTPGLLTASVGDAMHVHELCVDGELKNSSSSSSSGSSSSSSSSSSGSSSGGSSSSSSGK
mgnify:CR=1 FL=1